MSILPDMKRRWFTRDAAITKLSYKKNLIFMNSYDFAKLLQKRVAFPKQLWTIPDESLHWGSPASGANRITEH
jgi:hypothetical protein